jgi:NADH dehydrogenase
MSCQHAMPLGRFAGHNAAALLLQQPLLNYRQPRYGTGLDLGPWGAVQTMGWDRKIVSTRETAKARKQFVNCELIYPPKPEREAAFAAAKPQVLMPS